MGVNIKLDTKYLSGSVSDKDLDAVRPAAEKAWSLLEKRDGPGSDFLGWMDLPRNTTDAMLKDIEEAACSMRSSSDVVIAIGIGGSYLGAKAAIEMLTPQLGQRKVVFAGHNICGDYLSEVVDLINEREVSVNVISKSGTTTEPAVAFRVIEAAMRRKYSGSELKERIVYTTDAKKGALNELARAEGYRSFVIPDDVGGRFSVLTPVGLLPIACAGININDVVSGARDAMGPFSAPGLDENISLRYAALRSLLYGKGKAIEILSNFDGKLHYFSEWWKQLFGESEGKANRGIFPASCDFTTDLHSMGQWIQEGARNIFETFLIEEKEGKGCPIPPRDGNMDNLDYLSGKDVSFVNKKAYLATAEAHFEGGVPNMSVLFSERSPYSLGQLFYFFERAVAVSAYLLGVNPFDQPGVESYKKKMFRLLGRPGS